MFRVINDRGKLYIDKYNEEKQEWDGTEFCLSKVSLENMENSIYKALDYILHQS
jgi:hypothetical protein